MVHAPELADCPAAHCEAPIDVAPPAVEWGRTVATCPDCTARLVAAGCERDPSVTELGMGQTCEAHPYLSPGMAPLQVSSAVRLLASLRLDSLIPPTAPAPGLGVADLPAAVGPLTEIATRIFVAWTKAEGGSGASELTLDVAIGYARKLLERTKGR